MARLLDSTERKARIGSHHTIDEDHSRLKIVDESFAFHFIILTAYYVVKPIRDSIAASGRLETLPWMFTATLIVMLFANVIYAAIVARMERR